MAIDETDGVFVCDNLDQSTGYLSIEYGSEASYYFSSAFVLTGSVLLFTIDLRKYVLSRWHSHSHRHEHRKRPDASRPRTPGVASEQNTDGGVPGEDAQLQSEGVDDVEEDNICPPSCKVFT